MKRCLSYTSASLLVASILFIFALNPKVAHYSYQKTVRNDVRYIFNLRDSQQDRSWLNGSVFGDASSCEPKGNIVFIKTHKTGSTSLRNILNRYGLLTNLSFLLSKETHSGHFSSRTSVCPSSLLPPLGVEEGDFENYKFNISNVHLRPDWKELKRVMNPSSVYITILRHPVDQWLSSFQYFHRDKRVVMFSPFEPDPVKAFLRFLAKFKFLSADICNQQFRDMEVSMSSTDLDDGWFIRNKIEDYSKLFSLVLLTEYFDESLILLKKLLCWQLEDISYIKMREQPTPLEADSETRSEIERLNKADMMLYTHFNKTLWRIIDAYGRQQFEKDLKEFRDYLRAIEEDCIGVGSVVIVAGNHENVRYSVRNRTERCKRIVNYSYTGEIWRKQKKMSGVPN